MRDFYIYILQVNAGLAVFYLLYRLLTVKDTFFEVRRFFLLSVLLLAFIHPLISLAEWLADQQPLQVMIADYTEYIVQVVALPELPIEKKEFFTTENILWMGWGAGCTVLLCRFLMQLGAIVRLRLISKVQYMNGVRIIVLKNHTAPFSFFGWIFIDPSCYEERELQEILIHEKTHVEQRHSWDVLMGEILCIFFWFNPAVWLIRREIRQNLEFLADKRVLASGYNRKDYQYHLLRLSNQSAAAQIINNFNVSQLKKRIMMMNQKKTSKMKLVKYALVLPVTGLLILAGNARTVAEVAQEVVGQVVFTEQDVPALGVPAADHWEVKGRVTNEQGEGIPRVTITTIQGQGESGKAITTDAQGYYSIKVSGNTKEFRFSYPGMTTWSGTVKKGTSDLNVVMKPEAATVTSVQTKSMTKVTSRAEDLALEEVVVTGVYTGKDEKKTVVGYSDVDERPQFLAEGKDVGKFITKNIKYPRYAAEHGIQGTVEVAFVIDKEGHVTGAEIVKGVDGTLDAEAIRVVESMPEWKPGKKSGEPVNVRLHMPISFNLMQETENGLEPLSVAGTKSVVISVRSSEMEADQVAVNVASSVATKAVERDTNVFYITTKSIDVPSQSVSFTVSSTAGEGQSSVSPALYQASLSQINLDKQIVILNDKLVEDVKELPQDLSKVVEIRLLRDETSVRKMNKKYGKNTDNILIIRSK